MIWGYPHFRNPPICLPMYIYIYTSINLHNYKLYVHIYMKVKLYIYYDIVKPVYTYIYIWYQFYYHHNIYIFLSPYYDDSNNQLQMTGTTPLIVWPKHLVASQWMHHMVNLVSPMNFRSSDIYHIISIIYTVP